MLILNQVFHYAFPVPEMNCAATGEGEQRTERRGKGEEDEDEDEDEGGEFLVRHVN